MNSWRERWQDRLFTGHLTVGPITLYGANAMHWALNIKTRWGYLCLHPSTRTFGASWPWYLYLSPDGTPSSRTWGAGPGMREYPKRKER